MTQKLVPTLIVIVRNTDIPETDRVKFSHLLAMNDKTHITHKQQRLSRYHI